MLSFSLLTNPYYNEACRFPRDPSCICSETLCRWAAALYFQIRPPSEPHSVVAVCSLSVSLWEERCDFPTSAPTMYFFTSLLTFGWHSLSSAFPNPPRLESRLKSGWCNDFHFLKSTLDPRLTRRKDICCTWDQSQVGIEKLHKSRDWLILSILSSVLARRA